MLAPDPRAAPAVLGHPRRDAGRHPLQRIQRADRPPTVVTTDGPPRTRDVRARRGPRAPADGAVDGVVGDARGARARGGHLPFGRHARAPVRPCRAAAPPRGSPSDGADRGFRARRGLRARADRRGVPDRSPTGSTSRGSPTPRPADLGPGRKLLFVGRLDERKGFPIAIGAFERLAADRPDVHLIVVGDGPQRNAVDQLPTMLRARVTHARRRPQRGAPADPRGVRFYLGPSTGGESFGIVLVEAMAAGLPVVASDTPGYDEVVTDEGLRSARPAPRPGRARRRGRAGPGRCRRSPGASAPRGPCGRATSTGR